ncbi:hypothetical protein [Streptomyces sp. WAC06614]|uniref:hypothetical protein n=1 Tax=Streptomyces sp. WAC06614 TaxID=2487416 RepID=UPI000F78697D|nr:hypothetical protein [Streptomyces sp. WAC06614]RSS66151.1 hypothetical protein EF918_29615 [Streptomyces sp. WAC06614]
MGSTAVVWSVGVIPDEEAEELPMRFAHLPLESPPRSSAYRASMDWWSSGAAEREPFFAPSGSLAGAPAPTPAAYRFADLVTEAATVGDTVRQIQDAGAALMPKTDGPGRYVATARTAGPVAALFYGLGQATSELFPGWFGDFLLTAAEVRAALPGAREALAPPGARRDEAVARIAAWMTGMEDAPDFDAGELLDGPLRVLELAAATGSGVTAFSRWF